MPCTTRWTSASRARGARATARPASTWPRTRRSGCTSGTPAGADRWRTTHSVGCLECCGLTWLSTGQLPEARRRLARLLQRLAGDVPDGVPVVVLEPSCLALLRVDAVQLVAEPALSPGRLRTLAEHLAESAWTPPDLHGLRVLAQPHCHHASVLGWDADEQLLRRAGATLTRVSGCCGLAGDFGMAAGHYEVSTAVFGTALGPAVRVAQEADG